MKQLGLGNWQLLLGEADLTSALLGQFPTHLQGQIRYCLANLDRITLENLSLSTELKTLALSLLDLRGEPLMVLSQLKNFDLDHHCLEIIENLQSLFTLLRDSSTYPLPFTLDLSLIRTFDYYTGIVFEVVTNHGGVLSVLGQGGRYDRLLGLYHPQRQDYPGIGFSVNVETVQKVLRQQGNLPQTAPRTDWLVVGNSARSFLYAQQLRSADHLVRVEVYLGKEEPQSIRQEAKERGVRQIAWIREDQSPEVESL
jgi:ATP phosphoribosyltransferase regulatory subunit